MMWYSVNSKSKIMKNLLLFILIIVCIQTTKAQIPSSCIVSPALQTHYDADVKHLALKRIFTQNSPYKDSIRVPQNYQDTIWQGLAAVFNLTSVIQRDSVFDKYCIHQDVSYFVNHSIYVGVDLSYGWTQQWQNLNTTTGIISLDNLLSTYGFTVTGFYTFGSNYAVLTTSQNINVQPVCDSILTFGGVLYSEPNSLVGDGNKITYTKYGSDRFYDFTVGYGDCPAGCTGQHTFKFKVYDNCSVDYLGTFDVFDPMGIPSPTNCNITTNVEKKEPANFKIYPNPAEDIISVEANKLVDGVYTIFNIFGQVLKTGEFTKEIKISLKDLSTGVYFIRIENYSNNEFENYRIIKK